MAESWPTVKVIFTSYGRDFVKERDILLREVIPELRSWCESHQLQLQASDIRWGPNANSKDVKAVLDDISQSYFNNIMPFFVNITSDSIGLVPMWGEAPESMIKDSMKRLRLTEPDMELLFAAYREDNNNSIFVVRDDQFLADLMSPEEKRHFIPQSILPRSTLSISSRSLNKYPTERIIRYSYDQAGYDHCEQKMVVDIPSSLSSQILKLIELGLQREHPASSSPNDVYGQMRETQENFMKGRSQRLRGREDVITQIEDYIGKGEKDVPLLLIGGAGCGKSSVMARTADLTAIKASSGHLGKPGEEWHVFYHFVGSAPRSTELDFFLKRLAKELDIIHESALPNGIDAMAQLCCNALSNPKTKPVVVFVDALNQFDEEHAAVIMSWLPRKLAPSVRCVLSLISDTPQHRTLMSRESTPQVLHMTPLDHDARRQIVSEIFAQYRRSLSAEQMNLLLSKKTSENPLWLSIACEELRLVTNTKNLTPRIQSLPDGLLNLLEDVLARFSSDPHGELVIATLCLLEASATGLLEEELLTLLGDKENIVPPSPFDEKDEKEDTEKDDGGEKGNKKKKKSRALPRETWSKVFGILHPFLRPYGDSREGRLDFYHRAMSKAVRKKFFRQFDENTNDEEGEEMILFWHKSLAAFFEHSDNMDRKAEELLYHLCRINDVGRLIHCLTDWDMFDKLFNEEFSTQLLSYWRQVGGASEMITEYKALLASLEEQHPRDDELLAKRHEHIARIFVQAGKYSEALELATVALKLEEKDLGNRPERMVELYSLMSEIYDEKLKLNDFVSRRQIPDLRKTISYGRKSIALRKNMENDYHKLKLGLSLMKLAFSLESWEACGGDMQFTGPEALAEGNKHIDTALEIFKGLKDEGHYAEALMTKGVLAPRGSTEQLEYYNKAMEICLQVYGEKSLLTSRLYINIGIVFEDNKDYVKAYEYFCKWCVVSEAVLGPTHPKTLRAKGVLKEPRYRLVALRVSEGAFSNNPGENNAMDDTSINREVEEMDNDVAVSNEDLIAMDPEQVVQHLFPEGDGGDNNQGLNDLGNMREIINELLRAAMNNRELPVNLMTDPPQDGGESDGENEPDTEEVVSSVWTEGGDNRLSDMGNEPEENQGENPPSTVMENNQINALEAVLNDYVAPEIIMGNNSHNTLEALIGDYVAALNMTMDNRELDAREASDSGDHSPRNQQDEAPESNNETSHGNDAAH